ncbi:hypothetical protein TTHT_0765 [Thermotomaculum hydrothermale]|uniref:FHA domain-containing protein n=1 Tax=Thermotomaculum hydrothermale TaxID=981385 RepID=A0A7R6PMK8_9BACT|nr:FHA domain-containing protein [Thermotomaculum hydrothermale]BBB32333.1 hypothetical protein TTHT_0765 [Thermotomaculum hydrothermale]
MKVIFKPLSKEVENAFTINCRKNPRLTIGRKDTNDIVLPFRNVSSFHAIVECVDEVIYVEDLNSTNGTFVNDNRITGRVSVADKDRVRFATYEFLIEVEKEEEKQSVETDEASNGTVLMDASKVQEIQEIIEEESKDDNNVANKEKGTETVLYGVKGLVQYGRLVLLDENRNFLEEFELKESEISIGRDSINNISIDHPSISRVHCFINRKDDYYEVVDNDSTNGVFINDKKVKKAILKNGDILKLGDKEFVFIAPGELFSPSFLKDKKEKKSFNFDRKKVYITIFAVFFVLIVILALLPSGEKRVKRNTKISVKELKLDVINSFKNEDWDNVVYLIENFNLKGFENEYSKAKFEIENRKKYLKLVDLISDNNFQEAEKLLSTIDEKSVYYQKGQSLLTEKKGEFISNKLEEIDSLIDSDKIVEAYNKIIKLKTKFPENEKISLLAQELEKKYKTYQKRKKARQKYFALRRKVNSQANSLVEKAKELYLNGNIVDSIAKLIDARQLYIAKNLTVPSKIDRLKENLSKVRTLYLKGKKQVMQGNTEAAANNFEKLFEISKKYLWGEDGKIENECKKLLKDYYVSKANSFYKVNNYTKALDYANRVLDISPSDRSMQALKRDILRKAKSLYNKGYIEQTQYNNCKAALYYFRQVVEILPSSDPIYKKAMKRIKECEK